MKKRVALAQILSYDPATLLMDEPFGALDAQLKLLMQGELMHIWEGRARPSCSSPTTWPRRSPCRTAWWCSPAGRGG